MAKKSNAGRPKNLQKHELELQKRQHLHERNMAFYQWVQTDHEVKWLILLFVGMGVNAAGRLLAPPPDEDDEGTDYWQIFADGLQTFAEWGGAGLPGIVIANMDDWQDSGGFSNPWDLTAKMTETCGKGLISLSIGMLVMGKLFGTSQNGEASGGLTKLLGVL